jgi:hypothetical protein
VKTKEEIFRLLNEAEIAREAFYNNKITYEECLLRIKLYANAFNDKSRELAKKYGRKHVKFNISSFMR